MPLHLGLGRDWSAIPHHEKLLQWGTSILRIASYHSDNTWHIDFEHRHFSRRHATLGQRAGEAIFPEKVYMSCVSSRTINYSFCALLTGRMSLASRRPSPEPKVMFMCLFSSLPNLVDSGGRVLGSGNRHSVPGWLPSCLHHTQPDGGLQQPFTVPAIDQSVIETHRVCVGLRGSPLCSLLWNLGLGAENYLPPPREQEKQSSEANSGSIHPYAGPTVDMEML